jgi:hypothetical protein
MVCGQEHGQPINEALFSLKIGILLAISTSPVTLQLFSYEAMIGVWKPLA